MVAESKSSASTLGAMVERKLREGIVDGTYAPGMRMNEIELSNALEVSRTPVRTALASLAAEGLVNYTPNSGFIVRSYTQGDISGIFQVRATLCGLAAQLAAGSRQSDLKREVSQWLARDCTAISALTEWNDAARVRCGTIRDRVFETVLTLADNRHLNELLLRSRDISILHEVRFKWYDLDQMFEEHEAYRELFDAILLQQAVRADFLYREHVYRMGRRIVQQWPGLKAIDVPSAS